MPSSVVSRVNALMWLLVTYARADGCVHAILAAPYCGMGAGGPLGSKPVRHADIAAGELCGRLVDGGLLMGGWVCQAACVICSPDFNADSACSPNQGLCQKHAHNHRT